MFKTNSGIYNSKPKENWQMLKLRISVMNLSGSKKPKNSDGPMKKQRSN